MTCFLSVYPITMKVFRVLVLALLFAFCGFCNAQHSVIDEGLRTMLEKGAEAFARDDADKWCTGIHVAF